jgi:MGT family glycosyltransferase
MTHDFLLATWEGGGNVPPFVGTIRRLRARGHRVRVLGDDATRREMEDAGAVFVPWRTGYNRPDRRPESDPMRDWEVTEPGEGLARLLDHMTIGPAAAHATDTLAELRRARADVLLSSDLIFGPMIAAQATGTKLALLAPNVSLLPIPGMPPIGPGMSPPTTNEERAMAEGAAAFFAGMMAERLPIINAVRSAHGLPPLHDAFDQWRGADLFLLATSQAFDFPVAELPTGMRYVGPLLDPPAWAGDWSSPWPETDRRPLILVAMSSSFQNQAPTIQAVLDAAATLPVRLVVTLGPALAGAELTVPSNATVVDAAPHDLLMREAALVVTHCGHGTVQRALSHHRPMLCLPMGRDQNDNAARVVARGAGLRLAPEADTATLRQAISTILGDPGFARAAAALGNAIAGAEAEEALIEALEDLASRTCCRAAA